MYCLLSVSVNEVTKMPFSRGFGNTSSSIVASMYIGITQKCIIFLLKGHNTTPKKFSGVQVIEYHAANVILCTSQYDHCSYLTRLIKSNHYWKDNTINELLPKTIPCL